VTPAPVLSSYENASRSLSRDGGLSVALPNGNDLWIFADTGVLDNNSSGQMVVSQFITGGTSAEGPYAAGQIPTSLSEVPSPGQPLSLSLTNPPAQFPPAPTNVYLPDGSGRSCSPPLGQYTARWATGAALIPGTAHVLITYSEMCVYQGTFQTEGWGFLEYNWQTNALDVPPDDVFPPVRSGAAFASKLALGNPVISNGQVSLFSMVCTRLFVGCNSGQVYAATLPIDLATLRNPASYSVNPIATDGSASWQPVSLHVASYPDAPFRMIETTAVTGSYDVLTASSATGPWHLETTGLAQGCQGLSSGFCYSLAGHPELSTSSQLVLTYLDPGAGPMGTTGPVGHLVGIGASYTVPVPDAPLDLSAVASGSSVQLGWSPPSNATPGVTYNVYRTTTQGKERANAAAPIAKGVTGTGYTDSSVTTSTTYYYVVTATNPLGFEGLGSEEASTVPSRPPAPTIEQPTTGNTEATIDFTPQSSDGGSPITSYTATANDQTDPARGGQTQTGAGSPITITGLTNGDSYTFTVAATNTVGTGPAAAPSSSVIPNAPLPYHPVAPTRITDTRTGGGPLGPNTTRKVTVAGAGGVPTTGVSAVVLNVTATDPTAPSYLTVWPAGSTRPTASNLNFSPGQTVPNLVEVAVGANGQVSIYNPAGSVDVVVDLEGYVGPSTTAGAGLYNPLAPARITDTRMGGGPLGPNATLNVKVTGTGGVPTTGVSAVALNVTATDATASSYLTVWPTGSSPPMASNLNFTPGETVPNRVIVPVGTGGQVGIYNPAGSVDVVVDVSGYFTDGSNASATGSQFTPTTPARITDTRPGSGSGNAGETLTPGATLTAQVSGAGGVPAGAVAGAVMNVTTTDATAPSYLTVWPTALTQPLASDLNWVAGETVPNLVAAKLGPDGAVQVFNAAGSTDVVVDVSGWYS
jgi:fibronectin type 3 domain-containing protein